MAASNADEPGPVLVAVDFSVSSEAALGWAADWAGRVGAALVVLHVIHDPASGPGYYYEAQVAGGSVDSERLIRNIEDAAARMLDDFLARMKGELPGLAALEGLTTRLIVGTPVKRILAVADQVGAELVVMGSQGRTGLSHFMLGSTAERVARLSPVPVVIVKTPRERSDD